METTETVRPLSMFLSFRGSNLRSFRDEIEFSMLGTALADKRVVRHVDWRESGNSIAVLPAAGIFGANASGKTTALEIMSDMQQLVVFSFRAADPSGGVQRHPFLLDPRSLDEPSTCEIELILNGIRHRYGFIFDDVRFIEEWAYHYPRGRSTLLFHRQHDDVTLGVTHRKQGRAIIPLLRPNALFLSTAASANHPNLLSLYEWFQGNLAIADADSRTVRQFFTTHMLEHEEYKKRVISLLRSADLGVIGAEAVKMDAATRERMHRVLTVLKDDLAEDLDADDLSDAVSVALVHQGATEGITFDADDESLGTLVWFGLVGPVIDSLEDGTVLLIDELDASLHPMLVDQLVRLYQDPDSNPNNAQLIFNSHDIGLMGDSEDRTLGRDQIWLTEKLQDGSTHITPLADFAPRKQEAIGRRYMSGRYGSTPILFPPNLGSDVTSGVTPQ